MELDPTKPKIKKQKKMKNTSYSNSPFSDSLSFLTHHFSFLTPLLLTHAVYLMYSHALKVNLPIVISVTQIFLLGIFHVCIVLH